MNVQIELMRRGMNLSKLLRDDGWTLGNQPDGISFSHPDVLDEPAARNRLTRLGILTSGALRIEFKQKASLK